MSRLTTKEFVQRAIKVHGNKYDYSKAKIKNNKTKVTITCEDHGDFEQTPINHLSGKGCYECGLRKISEKSHCLILNS